MRRRSRTLFGRPGRRIDLMFRDQEVPAKQWRYFVDGEEVEAYSGVGEGGQRLAARSRPHLLDPFSPVGLFLAGALRPPGRGYLSRDLRTLRGLVLQDVVDLGPLPFRLVGLGYHDVLGPRSTRH